MPSATTRKRREPARTINCDWCDTEFKRYPSQIRKRNYCSRKCLAQATSKAHNPDGYRDLKDYSGQSAHLSRLNRKLNPTRMTPEVRAKLRQAHLGKGAGVFYEKTHGRHTHRIVAEEKIGRPLKPGEVVHHIDGNHRNNDPDNLAVMAQSEHIALHRAQGDLDRKRRAA